MKEEKGFTLLELLVVIGIIGVIAAIAIPQYASYRLQGFDAQAESAISQMASAQEAYYADYEVYKTCGSFPGTTCPASTIEGFPGAANGVVVAIVATPSGFTGQATHSLGSGKTFSWNSSAGGMQ